MSAVPARQLAMLSRLRRSLTVLFAVCATLLAAGGATATADVIDGGDEHFCAVVGTGVQCWGANAEGQLGDGTTTSSNTPVSVPGLANARAVAAGGETSCARLADRSVRCWGRGASGQLGDGSKTRSRTPLRVSGLSTAASITVGWRHACALRTSRTVVCWGANEHGELGDGTTASHDAPVVVEGLQDVVSVVAGHSETCAARRDGRVACWGSGDSTQLGGNYEDALQPRLVPRVTDVVRLSAGDRQVCALQSTGRAWCWGGKWPSVDGDFGFGPSEVRGVDDAVDIAAAAGSSGQVGCAIRWGGKLTCFEAWQQDYDSWQDYAPELRLREVAETVGVRGVAVVGATICAVRDADAITCFGEGSGGLLGTPLRPTVASTPVLAKGITDARSIAGGNGHICAVIGTGASRCWGSSWIGALGMPLELVKGRGGAWASVPTDTAAPRDATSIAAGMGGTCVQRAAGAVSCWGFDRPDGFDDCIDCGMGPGISNFDSYNAVHSYAGFSGPFVSLDTAGFNTCGVRPTGRVRCVGWYPGDGRPWTGESSLRVADVSDLTDAKQVVTDAFKICALRATGTIVCWPERANRTSYSSTTLAGFSDVARIETGSTWDRNGFSVTDYRWLCAIRTNGTVRCSGSPRSRRLGNGAVGTGGPVDVTGIDDASRIAMSTWHACVVRTTGRVACWGDGAGGRLGTGRTADEAVPADVVGIDDAVDIAVSDTSSCALRATGQIACWGSGSAVGDGGWPTGHTDYQETWERVTGSPRGATLAASDAPTLTGPSLVGWRLACGKGRWPTAVLAYSYRWLRDGSPIAGATTAGYTTVAADAGHDLRCVVLAATGDAGGEALSDPIGIVDPASRGYAPAAPALLAVGRAHGCVVRSARVFCFGRGPDGELGDGAAHASETGEVQVTGLLAQTVAAGDGFSCAVQTDRRVSCWGQGAAGRLGDSGSSGSRAPVVVSGLTDGRAIAAGSNHACAVRGNGTVWCWGDNSTGQLGTGDRDDRVAPGKVQGLTDVVSVAAGGNTSCAVRSGGEAVCWGATIGNAGSTDAPAPVAGTFGAVNQVAIGANHLCLLLWSAQLGCLGANGHGQLGAGFAGPVQAATPRWLSYQGPAVSLAAGGDRACAVLGGVTVLCWGERALNIAAGRSSSDALIPTRVTGVDPVTEVATGADRTCLLQRPGRRPACFGVAGTL